MSFDASLPYVVNVDRMTPHWLPNRTVEGDSAHFFVLGDWGGLSSPNRESMHFVHKDIKKGTPKWELDHNAQRSVAKNMASVGRKVKPFMVLNAGDNFYWGGVEPHRIGGQGIYDESTFINTFEKVYTDSSLKV